MHHISRTWYFIALTVFLTGQLYAGDVVRLIAGGDVMLANWIQAHLETEGPAYPFQHIARILNDADVVFANLEAPFGTGGQPFPKQYNFRVHPRYAATLQAGHINLVSIANNHIMDFGPEVLQETLTTLTQHDIRFAGAGTTLADARRLTTITVDSMTIGLLAYNLTFPQEFWATDTSAGTCFPYEEFVFSDIRHASQAVDFLIVSCHWGEELRDTPKPYQIRFAHQVIRKGADLVLGHHPHVVQGIEVYRGKVIAYSLGNFVFSSYSKTVKNSMLLEFHIRPDRQYSLTIHPINVYNVDVEFQPRLLEGEERTAFLNYLATISRELNNGEVVISNDGKLNVLTQNKPLD